MNYRRLGKTDLMVSEIGLGAEWLERRTKEECTRIIHYCSEKGINILDCWMSEPNVRSNIGAAIRGNREKWYIQGHIGSTWQNGQYVRTRDMRKVIPAFQDLLTRLDTDYIDLGMIHYVDEAAEFERITNNEYMDYVRELKAKGTIRHIGLSTHNPAVARMAAMHPEIEMILFSVNPAFDMLPSSEDIMTYFAETYDDKFSGIDPERSELYALCEKNDIGITVMKGYAGGRLFNAQTSPFGVALTPVQCLHYALTRPAVASVLAGYGEVSHVDDAIAYETATDADKDYTRVLTGAPRHSAMGKCTYCGHCAPCPVGIDIAMVNKLYDLAMMQETLPDSVKNHYTVLKAHASDCLGCKGCEQRCPFGVSIAERMKQTASVFGI